MSQPNEFPKPGLNGWIKTIQKEIKADSLEPISWKTDEGFNLLPVFNEDVDGFGEDLYKRGSKKTDNSWEINQEIMIEDFNAANKKALAYLNEGCTSITFNGKINSVKNLSTLLEGILIEHIETSFRGHYDSVNIAKFLIEYCREKNYDTKKLRGAIYCDPLGILALTGNWHQDETTDVQSQLDTGKILMEHFPLMRCAIVKANIYHEAGATISEEMAIALAHGHEYLNRYVNSGTSVDKASALLQFDFATGSNFFFEIARLRAFRILWSTIVEQYKPVHNCSKNTFIHSITSAHTLTIADQHNNLLRATTQGMSAILGGCNALTILPFDLATQNTSGFSERISKNIQLVLKEEAYLDKIIDPAGGSYYVESLTKQLAASAWKIFQEIEKNGGFIECLKNNKIQNRIKSSAEEKRKKVEAGEIRIIGVNRYVNKKEQIKFSEAAEKITGSTLVEPIIPFRLSEITESQLTQTT